ncbi:MAG: HAD family hydrolase [Bulleidia sp.]
MSEIRAVLFDCDGLMFNTEQVSQDMWRKEALKYGDHLSDAFFRAITGAKGVDFSVFEKEIPHLDEIRKAMNTKRFDLSFWSTFYPDGLNKPGLVELVQWLWKHDYRMAVCSSSSRQYVQTLLNTVSVKLPIETIVGGDMVKYGKPAPDIFLLGAKMLEVKPEECLVLEDSRQGIAAAGNAGMKSVFIEDTITPDDDMRKHMCYQTKDLKEVIDLLENMK